MSTLFRWPLRPAWMVRSGTRIKTRYGTFEVQYLPCPEGCLHKTWVHWYGEQR